MLSLMFYVLSLGVQPPAGNCEELAPRLDGTVVTICGGRVARVRDQLGNSREFDPVTGDITIRSASGDVMVLTRDGR